MIRENRILKKIWVLDLAGNNASQIQELIELDYHVKISQENIKCLINAYDILIEINQRSN